jgi:HK97 family phage prohead protease
MKIEFPFEITAADKETRIIEGRVVAFNETGNTSAGLTQFADGSIEFAPVKLLLEHDRTRPIGKSISFEQVDGAVIGKFKLANTTAANDALEEAATGLRSAFSVGVMVDAWDVQNNVNIVTASKLVEVSLVTDPAIKSATVQRVAASEQETEQEGSTMTNPEVEEVKTDVDVQVEASEAPAVAAAPATYTKPRLNFNKVDYLVNSIKAAAYNDTEARQYVMAADDNTTNNAGLIPTPQLGEVINPLSTSNRAFIDAISRGVLPASGMTFEIPKLTVVPTVDEVAEEAPTPETGMENEFLSVPVKKFSGGQTFSLELLDRSSPEFLSELVRQMELAYELATEKFVMETIANNGVLATTGRANDAAGLLGYVSEAASEVYDNSLGFARSLVVSTKQWGNIMGYNDGGRPIYNAIAPENAAGVVRPNSLRGNVAGLDLYVTRQAIGSGNPIDQTADYSMVIINPEAYTWYESPRLRLQTTLVGTGQIETVYYGYGACAPKIGAGAVWFNKQ